MDNYKYFILLSFAYSMYYYLNIMISILMLLLLILIVFSVILGIRFKDLHHEKRDRVYFILCEFFESVAINRVDPYKLLEILNVMYTQ